MLEVTAVGVNDNFFELGGDSILAIQVAARAQENGIALSPLDLFKYPSVAQPAQAFADARTGAEGSVSAVAEAPIPASVSAVAEAPALFSVSTMTEAPAPKRDFPLARVDRAQLDNLISRVIADKEAS